MSSLISSSHGTFTIDEPRRLVRLTRNAVVFETLAECRTFYGGVALGAEKLDRRTLLLLIDLRQAPARNDPAFEETVAHYRKRIFSGFARVAVLVRSAAGKLNVTRLAKDDGVDAASFMVSTEEDAALAWLESPGPTSTSRRR